MIDEGGPYRAQETLRVYMTFVGRPGGMDRISDLVVEYCAKDHGLRVDVRPLVTRGDRSVFWGLFTYIRALVTLTADSLCGNVDVLHINLASHGSVYRKIALAMVARRLKVPYVVHVHSGRLDAFWKTRGRILKDLIHRLFRGSRSIIVLSEQWSKLFSARLPDVAHKIDLLPNATPPASAKDSLRRAAAPSLRITFLGVLGPAKGTPDLIEALGRIASEPSWEATLAGSGALRESREHAERLGLSERVVFPGWVNSQAVDDLLSATDILTLPSLSEGLPMVILEAFAHGIPVIATPVGAIPEVIEDGTTGILVPTGNPDALADALRGLIRDPQLRARLGTNAHRKHLERYNINVYVQQLVSIWRGARDDNT